jgi:hypothetical protein
MSKVIEFPRRPREHDALDRGSILREMLGRGESQEELLTLADALEAEYRPSSIVERELVYTMISALWREARYRRIRAALDPATQAKSVQAALANEKRKREAFDSARRTLLEWRER